MTHTAQARLPNGRATATEACKAAVVLFILERLFLTRHASWLEVVRRRGGLAARVWRPPPRI